MRASATVKHAMSKAKVTRFRNISHQVCCVSYRTQPNQNAVKLPLHSFGRAGRSQGMEVGPLRCKP